MKDNKKTKAQIIDELAELRRRNAELEAAETKRKCAQESLRLMQFSIDRARDAIYWMGPDARFIYVNDAACNALGYSREELLTMSVHDVDPKFPAEVWPAHWEDVKRLKSDILESVHRTKDGRLFPVEIAINYMEFEGKEYNCAFARDVTERKRTKKALRETEEALAATLDATADGIVAVDENGQVICANRNFAKMWRIPPDLLEEGDDDELLTFVLDQLVEPGEFLSKVRELYQSVRDDFDTLHFRDGRVFERYSRPLVREGKLAGRVWSFRDVTGHERPKQEQ